LCLTNLCTGQISALIRKIKGGYRLYSRKKNPKTGRRRNLGTFKTKGAAKKHENLCNVQTAINRAPMPELDLDVQVKLAIYEITAETGSVPTSSQVSRKINIEQNEVLAAFRRLHAKRLLLPEPSDPHRIRMAPPFSGVPTRFPVEANGKHYYANCVWDAYGIAAALHCDAISRASDGHTGEPLTLEVKNGEPILKSYVAHFAVPAAHWWDDLIFT
jgi:hypothetical protein